MLLELALWLGKDARFFKVFGYIKGCAGFIRIIIENIPHELEVGEYEHVQDLSKTYQHLQRTHPIPENIGT